MLFADAERLFVEVRGLLVAFQWLFVESRGLLVEAQGFLLGSKLGFCVCASTEDGGSGLRHHCGGSETVEKLSVSSLKL